VESRRQDFMVRIDPINVPGRFTVLIRQAQHGDAAAMSEVLQELIAAGKRAKRGDPQFVLYHYLNHPHRLHCAVAIGVQGIVLGFQSLKIAREDNPYGTPIGWGIIGTHVRPSAARRGIASRLFGSTLEAARDANLPAIEAYIGRQNEAALTYYHRMGFRTYRETEDTICKALALG
jgi:GNAT superfamily N-acetyltransferase